MEHDPVTKLEWKILYDAVVGLRNDFKEHTKAETEERVKIASNLAVLNTKAGFWGMLGGLFSGLAIFFGTGKHG